MLLHAIQKRAARKTQESCRTGPVAAVEIECELNQSALDFDEIDAGRRNGDRGLPVRGTGWSNGDRCMLVPNRVQSHVRQDGKQDAEAQRVVSRGFLEFLSVHLTCGLTVLGQLRRECLETDSARGRRA